MGSGLGSVYSIAMVNSKTLDDKNTEENVSVSLYDVQVSRQKF